MEPWFKIVISELSKGNAVQLVGKGNSMLPLIKEGDTKTITPYTNQKINIGDVVFVRVKRDKYLTHKILEINDDKYTISNMAGKIDAIVTSDAILGIITRIGVDDNFTGVTVIE